MRFFAIPYALAGALALGACSGGGTNPGNPAPSHVIVSDGSGGVARVLAGSGIALSAIAVNGSGNSVLSSNRFRWSAALTSGQTYVSGSIVKPCGTVTQTVGGVTSPYAPDLSIYVAIDPVNESNIEFFPPLVLPGPAGGTASTVFPYCVSVSAVPFLNSANTTDLAAAGSLQVVVADPQNPLAIRSGDK